MDLYRRRSPCRRTFAVTVASWAMAMARTMDSARPWWWSTRAAESLEGGEDAVHVLGRDHRPGVRNGDDGLVTLAPGGDFHPAAGHVVAPRQDHPTSIHRKRAGERGRILVLKTVLVPVLAPVRAARLPAEELKDVPGIETADLPADEVATWLQDSQDRCDEDRPMPVEDHVEHLAIELEILSRHHLKGHLLSQSP